MVVVRLKLFGSPNPVLNIQHRVSLETWAFRRNRTVVVQVVGRCLDG